MQTGRSRQLHCERAINGCEAEEAWHFTVGRISVLLVDTNCLLESSFNSFCLFGWLVGFYFWGGGRGRRRS